MASDPNSTEAEHYRDALRWVHERLSVDGGMTAQEQSTTDYEIGNVLTGQQTPLIDAWKERTLNASR